MKWKVHGLGRLVLIPGPLVRLPHLTQSGMEEERVSLRDHGPVGGPSVVDDTVTLDDTEEVLGSDTVTEKVAQEDARGPLVPEADEVPESPPVFRRGLLTV